MLGNLEVVNNQQLNTVDAHALMSVGGDLRVTHTDLTELSFSSLTAVGENVMVVNNQGLGAVDLNALANTGGDLAVAYNSYDALLLLPANYTGP